MSFREFFCAGGLEFDDWSDVVAAILTSSIQPVDVDETRGPRAVAIVLGRRPELGRQPEGETCS